MTSIQMPQLGETIVEGTILKWLKAEGETIERDEPLFEISTDKVDTEVPSPVSGTVTKIFVAEGETVAVGTELAEISGEDAAGGAPAGAPAASSAPSASESGGGSGDGAPDQGASDASGAPASAGPPPAPAAAAASLQDRGPRSQILSPLVRRLAEEHSLDLSTIEGTGTGGRITKSDVMAAVQSGRGQAAGQPAEAGSTAPPVAVPSVALAATTDATVEPMSHIRKAIASHMLASVNETARAWTMVEVNVEGLVRLRERAKDAFLAAHGVKLTYLPFVVRATVDALHAHPQVNSRIEGENVVTPRAVHMGIAVSYDAGLIVPVIDNADVMNSVGIARAIADLAARARSHQLKPDEVQGATFTITNPGPYGSLVSVPIISQPNVGILSLDGIQRRPVVVEDDAIAVRSMVYLSMSWDHRLIDGEIATRFLGRVKQNLESWDFAEDLGDLTTMARRTWLVEPPDRVPYEAANDAMHHLAERRLGETAPDAVILLEHPPVFTAGRRARPEHLVWSEQEAVAHGAEVHHIDRGGSFTFHGPGQLVGYPVLHLGARPDAAAYLRSLEEAVILTGAELGVTLHRRDDVQTGVFAGDNKVCAIGVRLMRTRVTLHGFAINCDTDLSWFGGIVACGLPDNGVTSLSALLGRDVTVAEVRPIVRRSLADVFDLEYEVAPDDELDRFRSPLVA